MDDTPEERAWKETCRQRVAAWLAEPGGQMPSQAEVLEALREQERVDAAREWRRVLSPEYLAAEAERQAKEDERRREWEAKQLLQQAERARLHQEREAVWLRQRAEQQQRLKAEAQIQVEEERKLKAAEAARRMAAAATLAAKRKAEEEAFQAELVRKAAEWAAARKKKEAEEAHQEAIWYYTKYEIKPNEVRYHALTTESRVQQSHARRAAGHLNKLLPEEEPLSEWDEVAPPVYDLYNYLLDRPGQNVAAWRAAQRLKEMQ